MSLTSPWQAGSLLLVHASLVSRNPKGSGWGAIGTGLLLRSLVGTSQASLPCACELPLRATSLQVITRSFLEDSTIEHDCGRPSGGSLEVLHDPVCQRGCWRKEDERVTGGQPWLRQGPMLLAPKILPWSAWVLSCFLAFLRVYTHPKYMWVWSGLI